jgi:hypothetical protein
MNESGLLERLGDVLDIIAAAEMQFAQTADHHAYYGDRHRAVNEAIELIRKSRALKERE